MEFEPTSAEAQLSESLRFERLLSSLTAGFVNIAPDRIPGQIDAALHQVADGLGVERATLWEIDLEAPTTVARLTHYYQLDSGPPIPETVEGHTAFPWTLDRVVRGEQVVFSRLDELPADAPVDRQSFERFATRSSAILPLWTGGRSIGVVSFATVTQERRWSSRDLSRIALCSRVFADAIDRCSADRRLRSLSQRLIVAHEQERAWLARELHDDLTQRLAVLAIELAPLARSADEATAQRARSVSESLGRLSEDVHELAYNLHPTVLDDLGLAQALRAECDRVARGSLQVDLRLDPGMAEVDGSRALCLYRVLQEALRNAVRHSDGSKVDVHLGEQDGALRLTVTDDGVGFVPEAGSRRGLGLASMGERVELLGGEFRVDSVAGRGTTVTVTLPPAEGAG